MIFRQSNKAVLYSFPKNEDVLANHRIIQIIIGTKNKYKILFLATACSAGFPMKRCSEVRKDCLFQSLSGTGPGLIKKI
jgi:hypothetical protein